MTSKDQEKFTAGLDRMAEQFKKGLWSTSLGWLPPFDCVSRGKLMFRDQEKMQLLWQFRQAVDPEAPWAGFCTFGEIGPVEEHNCNHNYTAIVLTLG
jgi:small ligand-binding sensory domain FIST